MNNSFIIIGLDNWECASSTDVGRLTKALARNSKVLYVEPPYDCKRPDGQCSVDKAKGRPMACIRPMLRRQGEQLTLFTPPTVVWHAECFPCGTVRDTIIRINSLRYAESIAWASRAVLAESYVVVSDNRAALSPALFGALSADVALYYLSCSPMNIPLLRACDAVVSTSSRLTERARGYNLNSFDIGEGINPRNGRRLRTNWNKSALRISAILSMLRAEEEMFCSEQIKGKMYN